MAGILHWVLHRSWPASPYMAYVSATVIRMGRKVDRHYLQHSVGVIPSRQGALIELVTVIAWCWPAFTKPPFRLMPVG
jgi:hypothetical protein